MKYGRPIPVRSFDAAMTFEDAVKLLLVSFDSTIKANLSVGMPLDLQIVERDKFEVTYQRRIAADDPYFQAISSGWGDALKKAFAALPDYSLR
jgi:putative proteasome-type protease